MAKRDVRNFVCGITLRKGGWPTHRKRKEKAASRREWTGAAMDESARRHTRSVAMVNGAETRVAEGEVGSEIGVDEAMWQWQW